MRASIWGGGVQIWLLWGKKIREKGKKNVCIRSFQMYYWKKKSHSHLALIPSIKIFHFIVETTSIAKDYTIKQTFLLEKEM